MRYLRVRVRILLGPLELGKRLLSVWRISRHAAGGSSLFSALSLAFPLLRELPPVRSREDGGDELFVLLDEKMLGEGDLEGDLRDDGNAD